MDSNARTKAMPTAHVRCVCIQRDTAARQGDTRLPSSESFHRQARKRNNKAWINYLQPTDMQKQKLEQHDAYRQTLLIAKGRVEKKEAPKLDALQQPTRTARHRRKSISSWMRALITSRICAWSLECIDGRESEERRVKRAPAG
jgi:hypothetical protein